MTGTVYLVGSGPGDPDLLTVKARRLIEEADVVLHDKLPGPEIIDLVPEDRREDVGKRAGGERTPQSETNDRLVELAREDKTVVRLKGGDPFVFGRGGEEAAYLAEHGVPFEVVPGVTSAIAGPAVAGIPVTHRDHASSVSFVTGHEDPTKAESAVDWDALAATGGTIVVLMGVGKLPDYTAALREAGMDADTPVALVERGTWPDQRVATGTLDTIVDARDSVGIEPPAITVIGDVAAERERVVALLRGYGGDGPDPDRPAEAEPRLRVAVFRPDDERLADAVALLESLGATPVADPMLAVEPTDERPRDADFVVFTSKTGVEIVAGERPGTGGNRGWEPGDATVVAIGASTAAALREQGYPVDVVPEEYSSTGLVDALEGDVGGKTVELARSDHGSDVLVEGLEAAGATVNETVLYRLTRPEGAGESAELAASGDLGAATFTSSLTVEHFLDAAEERGVREAAIEGLNDAVVGVIGEPTRETAEAAGITVEVVPDEADFEVLACEVVETAAPTYYE